ncbi:Bifunctional inhibitor/lipid-transfer protein/seed storage 2S albumin superfamily protein [Rhynchospora pubera]|uniref:Bifunctional inhibitor/lipid-transfer protein/seed storage 2S albumin superfamily protein n=1 Tax=Rhynchospora pubera TaxID=906938 RepID=A0AAV8FV66_9POAL|nr:Bifunctional inhibitor/lipid-transfer protein/seed storage 2S albumin superfamily protein [Rhynchospora pubera]
MASLPSILLTLVVITTTTSTQTLSDSPDMAQCSASLLLLAPCMPFVQGVGPTPTDQCCTGLANLVRDQPSCICPMLGSSGSLPVNRSLVLQMPALCHVDMASNINITCPGITIPLPPSESPQASKHTSCSCLASEPTPLQSALMPLQRTRDQLVGQNKGEKFKLKKTLVSFYIIVLVLVIAR